MITIVNLSGLANIPGMIQTLDIITLGICSILASTAFGAVFFALWRRRRSERHLFHWAMSNWLYAAILLSLASLTPENRLLGCTLFALMGLSDVLIVTGIYRLDHLNPFRLWMVLPIAAALTGRLLAILIDSSTQVGTMGDVSEALGLAIAMGLCAIAILREPGDHAKSRGRRIAGLAMLGYLPGYAAVIIIRLWYPEASALLPRIPMLSDQVLLGILNLGLLAIPTERAHERLRRLASHDPLTGAWNREGLSEMGPGMLTSGSAVFAIDIDHFKSINDRNGHSAGDSVLIAVSEATASTITPLGGALFRTGGDEFIAIVPRCSALDAAWITDRLLNSHKSALHLPVWSLSIGVALIETSAIGLDEVIRRADVTLYKAKELGKNRAQIESV